MNTGKAEAEAEEAKAESERGSEFVELTAQYIPLAFFWLGRDKK